MSGTHQQYPKVNRKLYKGIDRRYVYSFHHPLESEGGEEGGVTVVYEGRGYTAKALYTLQGLKEVRR